MHKMFVLQEVYFMHYTASGIITPISSWGTIVRTQLLTFVLVGFQSNQHNRQSSKKNNKYQLLYTYGCTSGDGPRFARNMYRLMKYTKNKLCIKLGSLYTISSGFASDALNDSNVIIILKMLTGYAACNTESATSHERLSIHNLAQ